MELPKKVNNENLLPKTHEPVKKELPGEKSTLEARLEELEALPRRNAALHWVAFTLSLLSLILLFIWVLRPTVPVPNTWVFLDIGLGVIFAVEFFTRSGFRWQRASYLRSRFFDFIAIIPALVLVNHGFAGEGAWVWLILVARFVRVVDRLLEDGFITRNFLALVEGFEEEITDRVLGRIIARFQEDMDQAGLSRKVAEALLRNKPDVLQRIRAATPREGLVPSIARVVGLDAALERVEERSYDAIVGIINSEEIDRAVRDIVNSSFSSMLKEVEKKTWRKHLGILRHAPNK